MDWKFLIGDILMPIIIFVLGIFTGRAYERKASAKVKGHNNTVIQNSNVKK